MRVALQRIQTFFSSWRFAVFTVSAMLFTVAFLVGVLAMPVGDDALGTFAEDFKTWCFGYDPATGKLEWSYVVVFLVQPLVLAGFTAAVWSDTFREAVARPRQSIPYAVAGFAVVGLSAVAMAAMQPEIVRGELPFPADDLRTELRAPDLVLTDHTGATVDLEAYRGQVVMITAVYASCGFTCPMILQQSKGALAALTPEEQQDVVVLGITLDPEHDRPEVLAQMAAGQGVAAPQWHLLTGDPPVVEGILRDLNFAWTKDPETGVIDHANLFLLVDREGRIAYRFSLGERQQQWLASGLRTLVAEQRTASR